MPTLKKQKNKTHFIFIVDSYGHHLGTQLEALGLKEDEGYHVTGAGGSGILMNVPSWLNAKRLLVFMSSFHGDVDPAVELSRRIKAANPKVRIIFRSNSEHSTDPVFEKSINKGFGIDTALMEIVKEFLK